MRAPAIPIPLGCTYFDATGSVRIQRIMSARIVRSLPHSAPLEGSLTGVSGSELELLHARSRYGAWRTNCNSATPSSPKLARAICSSVVLARACASGAIAGAGDAARAPTAMVIRTIAMVRAGARLTLDAATRLAFSALRSTKARKGFTSPFLRAPPPSFRAQPTRPLSRESGFFGAFRMANFRSSRALPKGRCDLFGDQFHILADV